MKSQDLYWEWKPNVKDIYMGSEYQQDACSGVYSACREENGHKVDIYVHATTQTVVNMGHN